MNQKIAFHKALIFAFCSLIYFHSLNTNNTCAFSRNTWWAHSITRGTRTIATCR